MLIKYKQFLQFLKILSFLTELLQLNMAKYLFCLAQGIKIMYISLTTNQNFTKFFIIISNKKLE